MKKMIILGIISIIIIILFIFIIFLVKGTPWEKHESIEVTQDYLNETYSQTMIVNGVHYDIESNKYVVTAYPLKNQKIKFNVFIDRKGFDVWKDDFYLRYFSIELGKEVDEYTKDLFGEESHAYASLDGGIIDIYNISNLNENTKLEDVIDKFDQKYKFRIDISGEFFNTKNEIDKLYNFISYTNSLKYKPYRISFWYYNKESNKSNFHFALKVKEFQSITCTNDLLQYINKEME